MHGSTSASMRSSVARIGVTVVHTAAGWVGLAFSDRGLVALQYPCAERDEALRRLKEQWPEARLLEEASWQDVKRQLCRYYEGEPVQFDVPLDLSGYTEFQRRVWEATLRIPYGQTRSYAWLAKEVGSPRAYRAVGSAMAANPIPIIIPCHRVVRSNGDLGGYGGGLAMKEQLLVMERSSCARGDEPSPLIRWIA